MASVVTRKIPEIVLVDKEQLGVKELFTLNMLHKTDVSEFVICPHQRETIYLNKSFERAEDLIPILEDAFRQKIPCIIDCPVDYSENTKLSEYLQEKFE